MKTYQANILFFLLGAIVSLFFLRKCQPEAQTKVITIPAVSNEFKPNLIADIPHVRVPIPVLIEKQTIDSVYFEMPCDSVNKFRTFNSEFEDDFLRLNIKGVVQGFVHEITPLYTIKERTMEVELPKPTFKRSVFAFGTLGIDHTSYGVGVGFISKKSVYMVQYEPQRISLSVGMPLFSW